MNRFYRTLIGLLIVFFTSHTFAGMVSENIEQCPSLSNVATVKFKRAAHFDGGWFVGAGLHQKNKNWQVVFTFPDEGIESSKAALKRGQELFNSKVILTDPKIEPESGLCTYANYNPYVVFAEILG